MTGDDALTERSTGARQRQINAMQSVHDAPVHIRFDSLHLAII